MMRPSNLADDTPLRRQYLNLKRQHPDTILFFRLGDFYETFDEDAKLVARELQITLTSRPMARGERVPMAGVPHHAVEHYLARLMAKGYRVAMAEQLGEPGSKMMEREVLRVLTPGTVVEPGLLEATHNTYLLALVSADGRYGLAYIDASTGQFAATELGDAAALVRELHRVGPAECLVLGEQLEALAPLLGDVPLSTADAWMFEPGGCRDTLLRQLEAASLEAFGLGDLPLATRAAGGVLHYLGHTRHLAGEKLPISELRTYRAEGFLTLDQYSRRNLEILRTTTGEVKGSLLSVVDATCTPMGGRLLRQWLAAPLLDLAELEARQEHVAAFVDNGLMGGEVADLLRRMPDLERLAARCTQGLASPRDLVALAASLELLPAVRTALAAAPERLAQLAAALRDFPEVVGLVRGALRDEPPATLTDGGVIRPGFSPELDGLLAGASDAKAGIAGLEVTERERTGIRNLRVGYNRVFGYYIEVSNGNLAQVPADYQRKQTLAGGERFVTPRLKEYESIVLTAEERRVALETEMFERLRAEVAGWAPTMRNVAQALAYVDVVRGLAHVAVTRHYCRPTLDLGDALDVVEGRHPVIELALPPGVFVPNDCHLRNDACQMMLLTGPNMAGKSTYLRQVALIVLLAQIGSFVPAASAHVGLVDRVFTRVGAQDDLASGQSTFMVEMVETSLILQSSTPRSLIILDEVGRGTSTFDGLAIAQAVVEYIHNHPACGAKTLFATHYHELTALEAELPRVHNFRMDVLEEKGQVVFLRKVVPGGADRSYGIYVAKLAGAPRSVIRRAEELLATLEAASPGAPNGHARHPAHQLALFSPAESFRDELEDLDLQNMTPLQALNALQGLQLRYGRAR